MVMRFEVTHQHSVHGWTFTAIGYGANRQEVVDKAERYLDPGWQFAVSPDGQVLASQPA
ncbi:hypothetical protein [Streptomyces sp. NPDC002088]|uniref:hypothetical protein n=1 Tax=Streptomyces sp. NPDC002088 TaxID=3154665 RepID=UPI00331DB7BA